MLVEDLLEFGRLAVKEIEPDREGTRLGGREVLVDLICSMIGSRGLLFEDEK